MLITDKTLERFECKQLECHDTTFAAFKILIYLYGFALNQSHYAFEFKIFAVDATYSYLRSLCGFHCFVIAILVDASAGNV